MLNDRVFFRPFRGALFFSSPVVKGTIESGCDERGYNHDGSSGDKRNLSRPCGSWVAPGNAGNGEYDDWIKEGAEVNSSGKYRDVGRGNG